MTANEQHYEVPDEFYYAVLGPYLKYSSGLWKDENTTLAESEIYMLDLYVERAGKIRYSLS
jgi:cyclopropane-fatty-acyl-phospholipid synthase